MVKSKQRCAFRKQSKCVTIQPETNFTAVDLGTSVTVFFPPKTGQTAQIQPHIYMRSDERRER